jgi:hypothetical protein
MTVENATGLLVIITTIWIGWPLYRISDHLRALRELAEGKRK